MIEDALAGHLSTTLKISSSVAEDILIINPPSATLKTSGKLVTHTPACKHFSLFQITIIITPFYIIYTTGRLSYGKNFYFKK